MNKALSFVAAAMMFVTLVGTSAFADWRNPQGTSRDDSSRREDRRDGYRDNERVTVEGRIRNVTRERGGYRIELDRGNYSYWVPESRVGHRDLRAGISIRLGGVFRGGVVYVEEFGSTDMYREGYSYRDGFVRGVVDRVNVRLGYIVIRQRDGDMIRVDMRRVDRRGREVDVDDLRRGDYVEISGDWSHEGLFRATRVDSVRSRR